MNLTERISQFSSWLNDKVVGNPVALVVALVIVFFTEAMLPIQGYDKWNETTGLFVNSQTSFIELITGVAAVVAVVSVHKSVKGHHDRVEQKLDDHHAAVHEKLDALANDDSPTIES